MKKLLVLVFSILISFNSYGSIFDKTVCVETDSQFRDDVIYLPNKTKPFSGKNLCKYENGQNKSKGKIKKGKKNEIWTEWEENGQIKLEITYNLGQIEREKNYQNDKEINNTSFFYYENGLVEREDNYQNGKLIGVSKYQYYENGQIKEKEYYKDDILIGLTKYTYYENGQMEKRENYKDGEKDGKWTWWYENGQISSEGNYKDGKREGKQTYYYKNGQINIESTWRDGIENGKTTLWYENGQKELEGIVKDDEFNGKVTEWDRSGQIISVTNYKDGKVFKDIYGDCKDDVIIEERLYTNAKASKTICWYLDADIKDDDLIYEKNSNQLYTGNSICTFENGQIQEALFIKNGKFNGNYNSWYKNGQIEYMATYIDDMLDGKLTHCKNGRTFLESVYKDGECISGDC